MGMAKKSGSVRSRSDREQSDDESEYSDEEYMAKRPRNAFIDVEAEVDEEEEEEEEYDDEYQQFQDEFIAGEEEEVAKLEPTIYHKLVSRTKAANHEQEELDLEKEEKRLRELYGSQRFTKVPGQVQDEALLPEQFLLPTGADPRLWLVKCKPGRERSVVQALMQKALECQEKGLPFPIQSALCRENLKGYFYIEAYKQAHVQHALTSVQNVFLSKISLVPVGEQANVLRCDSKSMHDPLEIQPGQWVRIKRGKYAGDVARIVEVLDVGESLRVRLIPRLSPHPNSQERPQQRLFNPREISQLDPLHPVTKARGYWQYRGEVYVDGFLEKDFKYTALQLQSATPTLDELALFGLQPSQQDQVGEKKIQTFISGDVVKIKEGEFKGIQGTVLNYTKDSLVLVEPARDSPWKAALTVHPKQLEKCFNQGDHVQIIQGLHKGESGLLVKVEPGYATVFSDQSMAEYRVFLDDLCMATSQSLIIQNGSAFQCDLFDLVQLPDGTLGVVFKLLSQGSMVHVLDQNGTVREIEIRGNKQPLQVKNDLSRNISTVDAHGNQVHQGDQVKILDGPFAGQQASVLRMFRNILWTKVRGQTERAGLAVVRSTNLVLLGTSTLPTKASVVQRPVVQQPDSELLNRTITIGTGPYKGYLGIVRAIQGDQASIELHTTSRTVSVDRTKLVLTGVQPERLASYKRPSQTRSREVLPAPSWPEAQQPSTGKTPSWEGGKTPSWEGGKTPSWAGGKTPSLVHSQPNDWSGNEWSSAASGWSSVDNVAKEPLPATSSSWSTKAGGWDNGAPQQRGWDNGASQQGGWDSPASAPQQEPIVWGAKRGTQRPASSSVPFLQSGCCVRISGGEHAEAKATVLQAGNDTCECKLESGTVLSFPLHLLEPIRPSSKDRVLVAESNEQGTLMSMERGECLVRLQNGEIRLVPYEQLIKLAN